MILLCLLSAIYKLYLNISTILVAKIGPGKSKYSVVKASGQKTLKINLQSGLFIKKKMPYICTHFWKTQPFNT